jgi:beta-glucosidase
MGIHAPGIRDRKKAIAASHHTALAHGLGARAMRAVRKDLTVGLTVNMTSYHLENRKPELLKVASLIDGVQNRWWIDAFTSGHYPADVAAEYGKYLTEVCLPGDDQLIKVETDFLGVNYYADGYIGDPKPDAEDLSVNSPLPLDYAVNGEMPVELHQGVTDFGWPVTPEGLGDLLERIHQDWPQIPSIVVTENGAAYNDEPDSEGQIKDERRIKYLTSHVSSMMRAKSNGVPVDGYFAWSLLDNFEWAEGYSKRFGLIHVDFNSQKRTPKESFYTYADLIAKYRSVSNL